MGRIKTAVTHQFLDVEQDVEVFRIEFASGREHQFGPIVLPAKVICEVGCGWNCHKELSNEK
jgi:hypothetical protein